jgi:hypothetical protein
VIVQNKSIYSKGVNPPTKSAKYFRTSCVHSAVPEADYFWFGGGVPEKLALGGVSACTDFFSFGGRGRRAGANLLDEQIWSLIDK